jgi:hypothetical protein
MSEQARDYAVGYGKPPMESRFQKGQSGNPGGRPRRTKTLVALLGEALSRRSGYPKADGSWMTQAEAIFTGLVGQAAGSDPQAKKLLFDVLVKLQRANICWPQDHLPEIELDDSNGGVQPAVSVEDDGLAQAISSEAAAQGEAQHEAPSEFQSAEERAGASGR